MRRRKTPSSLRPREVRDTLGDEPAEGAVVAGRYRLERVLGQGGMGSVWAGWDDELERLVAIKFMAPEIAENRTLRARFNHEAKAAARLRTRHVTQVFDFGVDGRTPFIVMEFLEGEDLRTCLKHTERLPPREVARIVNQASLALRRAQEAGIVHRDIKPANVFLARADDEDVVKILDFGVAKTTSQQRTDSTKSGVVLGSPPYLSPEQARGMPLDHRSDLWALAATAYRALTGRVPFDGNSDGDVIVRICTDDAPAPSTLVSGVPASVDAFFVKAFKREPSGRYQTAAQFARAFSEAIGGDGDADISGAYTPRRNDRLDAILGNEDETLCDSLERPEPEAEPRDQKELGPNDPDSAESNAELVPTPEPWSEDAAITAPPEMPRGRRLWVIAAAGLGAVVVVGLLAFAGDADEAAPSSGASAAAAGDTAPAVSAVGADSTQTTTAALATSADVATASAKPATSASAPTTVSKPLATTVPSPPAATVPPPVPKATSTGGANTDWSYGRR